MVIISSYVQFLCVCIKRNPAAVDIHMVLPGCGQGCDMHHCVDHTAIIQNHDRIFFSLIFFRYRRPRIQTVWGFVCRGADDNSIAWCQDSYDWPSRRWIYGPRMRWDLEFHVQSRGRRFRTSAHPRRTNETLPNMWRGTIFYNLQQWHVGVKNNNTI